LVNVCNAAETPIGDLTQFIVGEQCSFGGTAVFGLIRDQWVVTKGIREIVVMAERDSFLMPSKREEMVTTILECSRDLGIATKGFPAHGQVMIVAIAFFGIAAGPTALSDAAKWAAEYANRHTQHALLAVCMEIAADLMKAVSQHDQ
jgi:hypothetical protein